MAVTLNASTVPQPSGLSEGTVQIKTDKKAIDGSQQRNRLGQKKFAILKWDKLIPADYQTLLALVETGASVAYSNNTSNRSGGTFAFTGLTDYKEGDYIRGGTLVRGFEMTITEA